jgi:restriction endonuclease S subunit
MMWKTVKLEDVATIIAGQSPTGENYNKEGLGMPFYQGKKDYGDKFLKPPTVWTKSVTKVAIEGDVLMSVRAPVGALNIATEEICIGRGLAAIRVHAEIDKDYLFYALAQISDGLTGSSGAIFNSINKKQIESIKFSLPPLAEQQRTVAKLDAAFAEIDGAIANCNQQILNMECLNQRVVDEAFNNESEHLEFDSVVREKGTGLERRANLQSPNNSFPYLKMNNISPTNRLFISEYTAVDASEEEVKKYTLNDGDFLFNTRNSVELVGKSAVVSGLDGWLFNNNILRVKFIEGINADYINFFFGTSFGKRQLNLRKTGTTNVAAVYYKDLKTIEIPIIKEVEQLQIVKKLKAAETEAISFTVNINDKIANLLKLRAAILVQELQSEAA